MLGPIHLKAPLENESKRQNLSWFWQGQSREEYEAGVKLVTSEYFHVTLVSGICIHQLPASWTTGELVVKQAARKEAEKEPCSKWPITRSRVWPLTFNRTIFVHQCLCDSRKRQDPALRFGRACPSIFSEILAYSMPPIPTSTFPKSHQNKWETTLWPPAGKNSNCDCLPRKPT